MIEIVKANQLHFFRFRVAMDQPLRLLTKEPSELILIDVPSCKGWGYPEKTLKGEK